MSNHDSSPAAQPTAPSTDRPTATYPTARKAGLLPSPFAGWRDQCPTEQLPVVGADAAADAADADAALTARARARARARVYHTPSTKVGRHRHRHLRAALAGILIAAALLTGLQLYAAAGIAQARHAALAARTTQATEQATPAPAAQPDVRSDIQPDWVTEDTGAAYDRTDPAASPLDLPRCTTSPDTPLPCLATISPSQTRAVVLEEDASLTALVRR